jgi:hypothetical protein
MRQVGDVGSANTKAQLIPNRSKGNSHLPALRLLTVSQAAKSKTMTLGGIGRFIIGCPLALQCMSPVERGCSNVS